MANTHSATSCSGVITDHLLVKCLNLIFHFNLRVFQHDIAGSLPSKLVWYHLNPLDLVSHLPLGPYGSDTSRVRIVQKAKRVFSVITFPVHPKGSSHSIPHT